ncbi:distribution and morphology protein Mdm35 [Schizosaccharomyces japonicus yFS275]|uniref:Distribution and morphology protein Mdm35 n=1 Tax=Schizosaccharomyces japonicus (strain yFS275 / FY16936) TaxID=402676 RepID=T0S2Y2_SCHJY|nr:distribution and morphology protein Mdm35 [Schizosaccharomyces japonicus yFS275]EQC52971.1 distribution and morphology protein Mdm35 [Schizosaccharomyces japonicus yFS275]
MSSSIAPECTNLKKRYDACFNEWYTGKFLKGDTDDSQCAELFQEYRKCVQKHYGIRN